MITLIATWAHHSPKQPYRVQAEMLDLAEILAVTHGYEIVGTASGYAVQENESDVSMTIQPRPARNREPMPLANLLAIISDRTGRNWQLTEAD